MKNKFRGLLLVSVACSLLLCSCSARWSTERVPLPGSSAAEANGVDGDKPELVAPNEPEPIIPNESEVSFLDEVDETNEVPKVVLPGDNPPPDDMTWISPGKVTVSNFYPGARAEYNLVVHNGRTESYPFEIKYRIPDNLGEGFVAAPVEAQNWVIIADSTPILEPKETKEILVVLEMPNEASSPSSWEFWVSVRDVSQVGMVQTELCSRWQIYMR